VSDDNGENQAFIDGQNLFLGTTQSSDPWKVDLYKFRIYLRERYNVEKAYYFIGRKEDKLQELYERIRDAGYILVFRAHSGDMKSSKKGNVDTDIVFMTMKVFHESVKEERYYFVSGDGDYYKMIKYLQLQKRLGEILFPSMKKSSSLYRQIGNVYYDYLDKREVREKIKYQ
jgi:hypothetical protein